MMFGHHERVRDIVASIEGSCWKNNDELDPSERHVGCAVMYLECTYEEKLIPSTTYKFRLESEGYDMEEHTYSHLRCDLRAAIVALGRRKWRHKAWSRYVIATENSYLVPGVTEWITIWQTNNWKYIGRGDGERGKPVAEQDLWLLLLEAIRLCLEREKEVLFWSIPWDDNLKGTRSCIRGFREPARSRDLGP
jgi:ribonuclease HI